MDMLSKRFRILYYVWLILSLYSFLQLEDPIDLRQSVCLSRCDLKSKNVNIPAVTFVPIHLSIKTQVVKKDIGPICNAKSKKEHSD